MDYHSKYLKYKKKYLELKKEHSLKKLEGGAMTEVILFKAEWCGHCTHFLPVWDKMEKKYKSKYSFTKYDSDKDTKILESWGVNSFPTIIVKKGDIASQYHGSREENDILNFIKDVEKASS